MEVLLKINFRQLLKFLSNRYEKLYQIESFFIKQ